MEISLCMIVKNEEDVLGNCLESIHELVDEIIIVDTGSTDRTKEIAAGYTDKIYDFEWIDDFSAARNFSFSKATKDYVMWLDADDILKPENKEGFLELKNNLDPKIKAVFMPYHYSFAEDGRLIMANGRERIIKRSAGFRWINKIHEVIGIDWEDYITSDIPITHAGEHPPGDRNFNILKKEINSGEDVHVLTYFYYADELERRGRINEAIVYFEKYFEDGGREITSCFEACIRLHDLYVSKKQYDKALKLSVSCLPYCIDKSEFCCQLGYFYAHVMKDLNEAITYFEMATQCPYPSDRNFIAMVEFYYYKPWKELGTAHYLLGRPKEALECFEEALKYRENSEELMDVVNALRA